MKQQMAARTRLRWAHPIVGLLLLSGALTAATSPAMGTTEDPPEVAAAVVLETGPNALVRTIGLRSTMEERLGRYVAIGADSHSLKAYVPNQLDTEFGLFRANKGKFKLLGPDGAWVKFKWNKARTHLIAGTWTKNWKKAWSFSLIRSGTLSAPVINELDDSGIDAQLPVCVRVFSRNGTSRGLLAIDDIGRAYVDGAATCGADTATLFMTDAVPVGTSPKSVRNPHNIDPISQVRFTPPDGDALSLTPGERIDARNAIDDFFRPLGQFNTDLKQDVLGRVRDITELMQKESFIRPGDEKEELGILDAIVDAVTGAIGFIPGAGDIVAYAVKTLYDVAMIGVTAAENANATGPRVLPKITNAVVDNAADLKAQYRKLFVRAGNNLDAIWSSLLEDCPSSLKCKSDRTLAKWLEVDPTPLRTGAALLLEQMAASHEVEMWKRLLPIRGVLYQPPAWFLMPSACGQHTAYTNAQLLPVYQTMQATVGIEAIMVTAVFTPFHNKKYCFPRNRTRPYMQTWTIGMADDAGAGNLATPLSAGDLRRLFEPYDPEDPIGSGLGLSKKEVACQWLDNPVRGYNGSYNRYFNPCHFAFYDHDGDPVNAFAAESGHYIGGLPWTEVLWAPEEVETDRSPADPDVFSAMIPRAPYSSCDAYLAGEVQSATGGDSVAIRFANLHSAGVNVYSLTKKGALANRVAEIRPVDDLRPDKLPTGKYAGGVINPPSTQLFTTAGTAYVATDAVSGACLGAWTAAELPDWALVDFDLDYSLAEIHGPDGILVTPTPTP